MPTILCKAVYQSKNGNKSALFLVYSILIDRIDYIYL